MEFVKQTIENYTWKVKNAMQFTIDDAINVSENLLDMERLILVKGNVVIEETQAMVDRFQVKGSLHYRILYGGDKEGNVFDSLTGKVPFIEYVNADGTKETDYIEVRASLNDLTVTMLHSRKVSMKALIGLDYQVKERERFDAISEVSGEECIEVLSQSYSTMCLKLQETKKLQVSESVEIPANKPDIYQVIWKSMSLTGTMLKPEDGYIMATGTLNIFLVYTAEEEGMPIQYFTVEVPFEQRMDVDGSDADMVSGSFLSLDQYHIAVVPDEKGHDRIVELSGEFTAEVKLYGSENLQLVRDAYSTRMEIVPQYRNFGMQHLLIRNCAKTKVVDTLTMPKQQSVLQICNVEGSVSIDDTQATAKGIVVEGVVSVQITYLNKEENGALSSVNYDIPFSYEIEVPGMREGVTYSIMPFLDSIMAVQSGGNDMEIKAEVSLEVLAFTNETARAVLDMERHSIDQEQKKALPGVIGYIVKKEDTLWSIAKAYYTTVDRIRMLNELENDQIKTGDRLVILKE